MRIQIHALFLALLIVYKWDIRELLQVPEFWDRLLLSFQAKYVHISRGLKKIRFQCFLLDWQKKGSLGVSSIVLLDFLMRTAVVQIVVIWKVTSLIAERAKHETWRLVHAWLPSLVFSVGITLIWSVTAAALGPHGHTYTIIVVIEIVHHTAWEWSRTNLSDVNLFAGSLLWGTLLDPSPSLEGHISINGAYLSRHVSCPTLRHYFQQWVLKINSPLFPLFCHLMLQYASWIYHHRLHFFALFLRSPLETNDLLHPWNGQVMSRLLDLIALLICTASSVWLLIIDAAHHELRLWAVSRIFIVKNLLAARRPLLKWGRSSLQVLLVSSCCNLFHVMQFLADHRLRCLLIFTRTTALQELAINLDKELLSHLRFSPLLVFTLRLSSWLPFLFSRWVIMLEWLIWCTSAFIDRSFY